MRSVFVIILVATFLTALEGLVAQDRFIRVFSQGSVEVKPDVATITAYVIGGGDTVKEATEDCESKTEKAKATFDPMEYRDVELTVGKPTFSMEGSNPMAALMGGGMMAAGGDDSSAFQCSCTFEFKIQINKDFTQEKINSIVNHVAVGIEKAELKWSKGMPQTNVLTLSLSDPTKALDEAMKKAVDEARRKATKLAELHGKKLGDVISINETSAPPQNDDSSSPYGQIIAMYSSMFSGANESDNGMIQVSSNLEVTFALVD